MIYLNSALLQWPEWSTCLSSILSPDGDNILYHLPGQLVLHFHTVLGINGGATVEEEWVDGGGWMDESMEQLAYWVVNGSEHVHNEWMLPVGVRVHSCLGVRRFP